MNSRLSPGHPDGEAEVRLFYVAMTRAKRRLIVDPNMLSVFTSGSWRETERPAIPAPVLKQAPLNGAAEPTNPDEPDHSTISSQAVLGVARRERMIDRLARLFGR
jgi:hypothetical protein